MTLIKLDSGAEIVVEHVDAFHAASDSTAGHPKRVVVVSGIDYRITEADHDRIVEAINGQTVTTAQDDGLRPFTAEDFKNVRRSEQ